MLYFVVCGDHHRFREASDDVVVAQYFSTVFASGDFCAEAAAVYGQQNVNRMRDASGLRLKLDLQRCAVVDQAAAQNLNVALGGRAA